MISDDLGIFDKKGSVYRKILDIQGETLPRLGENFCLDQKGVAKRYCVREVEHREILDGLLVVEELLF